MKKLLLFLSVFSITLISFCQDLLMQNGTYNQCSGIFYDSGGTGDYGNDENMVMTICPDATGDFIQLSFTEFSTQFNADVLTIYDGDDTTAPVIGSFSGGGPGNFPGDVTASQTNPTGCLTIEFISDSNFSGPGWAADILCGTACQDIIASVDSTTPPIVDGIIEIFPGETVNFSGSATFSNDGTGATYEWDFGEGAPQNGQNTSHTFNNSGVFLVTLTVTDTNPTGCSDEVVVEVHVLSDHVTVDPDTYTELQLVEDVLIDSGCASVDNLTFQGGPNSQGIAYFNKSGSNFPFDEGIILMSGDAEQAEGPETGTLSTGGWDTPDADLEAAIPGLNSGDATWMEFDFTPLANEISFNFIFASEEYGTFQCSFADGFAFLLTEVATGITTNLAVVPGTTNPVSVLTIRDQAYNGSCSSVNPQYFAAYYDDFDGLPENTAPINFKGHTVSLTAVGTVVPNTLYSIKLAIADHNDTLYDSAVFLEGGSFNLGGELGNDISIAASNTVCYGEDIILDTGIIGADGSHVWYLDGVEIQGETNSTITVTEPGNYSVEVVLSADCQTSDSVNVEFYPTPIVESLNNLFLCNPGSPPYIFDLTQNTSLAIGSQPNASDFVVTYHNNLTDAENDIGAITNPDVYPGADTEIIYVRIDYPGAGCYATDSFTLNITPEPTINAVGDMVQCDDSSNDGVADFDLESQTATILGAQPTSDFVVTYYDSQAAADAGTGWLSSPFSSSGQPIWVRVELASDSSCSNVSVGPLFDLVLNPVPDVLPASQSICDNVLPGDDGYGEFDLTLSEGGILNGLPSADHAITYYEDPGDAESGPGAPSEILTPASYINTSATTQTIYVRVENTTTNCHNVVEFSLQVDPLPAITSLSTNTDICNGDDAIFTITGTPGDVVDYTINGGATQQVTINASGEGVVTEASVTSDQTITLELVTNPTTTCSSSLTDTATVTVVSLPSILSLTTNTDICSGSDAIFTITGTPNDIVAYNINGGTTAQVTLDATTGEGLVTVTGATSNQVITLEQVTSPAGCSSPLTDTATILVNPNPTATVIANGDICPNETASFTITGSSGDVVDYNINGGATQQATLDVNGEYIETIATVTVDQVLTLEQVVNTTTSCWSTLTATATVVVNPLPTVVAPTPLIVCDDTVIDGITEMDLTVKNDEISGGNTNYIVTYYNSLIAAQGGMPQVAPSDTAYIGTDGETLYVRVEDMTTGCFDTTMLQLNVSNGPSVNTPTDLHYCDPDNDGLGNFDLSSIRDEILAIDPTLDVSFHLTYQNALDNVNPQGDMLSNVAGQVIYVRVDFGSGSDCPTIVQAALIVDPTPIVPTDLADYALCDDDGDGVATFNLTTMDADIYGTQNPNDYTLTYHETLADAEAIPGANPIMEPDLSNYQSGTTTIYVRLEDDISNCLTVGEFNLVVNPIPDIPINAQDSTYEICDDSSNNDGYAIFDLTNQNDVLTAGNASYIVDYYETMADIPNNPIPDYTAYANTSIGGMPHNPQTIFATVTETTSGSNCYALTTLTLVVNTLPTPNDVLPDLIACDDNNVGDMQEAFALNQNEALMQNDFDETVTYHESLTDAELGENPIDNVGSYTNTTTPQTIYVRVTDTGDPANPNDLGTGCYSIVTFDLIVNPLPEFIPDDLYIICVNTNGTEVIGPPTIDTGLSPTDYTFEWLDENGTIVSVDASYTATLPGTYTVEITNTTTNCSSVTSVVVEASSPPVITAEVTTEAFSDTHVIVATATGTATSYEFSIDNGPWVSNGTNTYTFTDLAFGEHIVMARDANGCGISISNPIFVMDYPLYFTPNNDGFNDTWQIVDLDNQYTVKIYIFDRYGKLLKQLNPAGPGWDGTYNGEAVPSNDYWFTVEYREPGQTQNSTKEFKAHFTLKR